MVDHLTPGEVSELCWHGCVLEQQKSLLYYMALMLMKCWLCPNMTEKLLSATLNHNLNQNQIETIGYIFADNGLKVE